MAYIFNVGTWFRDAMHQTGSCGGDMVVVSPSETCNICRRIVRVMIDDLGSGDEESIEVAAHYLRDVGLPHLRDSGHDTEGSITRDVEKCLKENDR